MLATDLILQKVRDVYGVKGCLIVGEDGLVIDSILPEGADKEFYSAIVSAIFTESNKQSNRIGRGSPHMLTIETDDSTMVIIKLTIDNEILNVFTDFKIGSDTTQIIESMKKLTEIFK